MSNQDLNSVITQMLSTLDAHYQNENAGSIRGLIDGAMKASVEARHQNLFEKLVKSIHNANKKAESFKTFWAERREDYEKAFEKFNYMYAKDLTANQLLNSKYNLIKSQNKLEACISAAQFLYDLEQSNGSVIEFFDKFAHERSTVYERWALVGMLSHSIKGIGTALACDFLKEIGYLNIGKPDVHVKRIMCRIGLWERFKSEMISGDDNFICFRILDKLSQASGKTVYEIDKIFWHYGSGFETKKSKGICIHDPKACECNKCNVGISGNCQKNFDNCK